MALWGRERPARFFVVVEEVEEWWDGSRRTAVISELEPSRVAASFSPRLHLPVSLPYCFQCSERRLEFSCFVRA